MDDLMDRVQSAFEIEADADRKALLSECWIALNMYRILKSQFLDLKARASQITVF